MLTEHGWPIAPSSYYAAIRRAPSVRGVTDAYLIEEIKELQVKNKSVYGVLKVWHALLREGHQIGRERVRRLMRAAGIIGVRRGQHHTVTTQRSTDQVRFPDLVDRIWDQGALDLVWIADFTYVWTYQGFCYVSFVTDACSRRILGFTVAMHKETELVSSALQQALSVRRRNDKTFSPAGIKHHSDAGSQYTSAQLRQALAAAGMDGSIGTVGDAYDNAMMESTIGLYKTELIDLGKNRTWKSLRELETQTAEWVRWYNTERLHSMIGYVPPMEFEDLKKSVNVKQELVN